MHQGLIEYIDYLQHQGVPEKEYFNHIFRYLDAKAQKEYIPLHGSFELTPLCNLDCKMCYIHLNHSQISSNDLLSFSDWEALIEQAQSIGMISATLTGGECLTYPFFDEVYLKLFNMGIFLTVMTNGVLLDEKRLRFFEKYPPRAIQISIYGSSNNAYEEVTGHRVFDIVNHNLQRLNKTNIPISLTITPSNYMRNDISALLSYVEEMHIPYYINSMLIEPREDTGRSKHDLSIEDYIQLYNYQLKIRKKEHTKSKKEITIPEENHGGEQKCGLLCDGGRSSFLIQYNGAMSPCSSLPEITSNPLKDGFEVAWHQINSLANQYIRPRECEECVYHDYCLTCPALHKNSSNPGHCNPNICKRTKLFVKAGLLPVPE